MKKLSDKTMKELGFKWKKKDDKGKGKLDHHWYKMGEWARFKENPTVEEFFEQIRKAVLWDIETKVKELLESRMRSK